MRHFYNMQKCLILMMLQIKTIKIIIKNGHLFYIIHNTGGSGSEKTNALLTLIKEKDSDNLIGKIYLYANDLNEPKYQLLIKKFEDVGIKDLNDPKAFIDIQYTWMMFTIILMVTIQIEK